MAGGQVPDLVVGQLGRREGRGGIDDGLDQHRPVGGERSSHTDPTTAETSMWSPRRFRRRA
jgi:hypothetical protein